MSVSLSLSLCRSLCFFRYIHFSRYVCLSLSFMSEVQTESWMWANSKPCRVAKFPCVPAGHRKYPASNRPNLTDPVLQKNTLLPTDLICVTALTSIYTSHHRSRLYSTNTSGSRLWQNGISLYRQEWYEADTVTDVQSGRLYCSSHVGYLLSVWVGTHRGRLLLWSSKRDGLQQRAITR